MLGVKRKAAEPAMTPARQALAHAIAERARANATVAGATTAKELALTALIAAEQKRDDAIRAIKELPEALSVHMIAVANGRDSKPPQSLQEAQRNVEAAEMEVTAADRAYEAIKAALDGAQRPVEYARSDVARAASLVMRDSPAVRGLVDEVLAMQERLYRKMALLRWLEGVGALDLANVESVGQSLFSKDRNAVIRWQSPPQFWLRKVPEELIREEGILAPWLAVYAALQEDAAAPVEVTAR